MIVYGYTLNSDEVNELEQEGVYVYIIRLANYTYYTGISRNIVVRLLQHSKGQCKSTKYKRPVVLKYLVKLKDYKEARWLEKKIKNKGAKRYLCHIH